MDKTKLWQDNSVEIIYILKHNIQLETSFYKLVITTFKITIINYKKISSKNASSNCISFWRLKVFPGTLV